MVHPHCRRARQPMQPQPSRRQHTEGLKYQDPSSWASAHFASGRRHVAAQSVLETQRARKSTVIENFSENLSEFGEQVYRCCRQGTRPSLQQQNEYQKFGTWPSRGASPSSAKRRSRSGQIARNNCPGFLILRAIVLHWSFYPGHLLPGHKQLPGNLNPGKGATRRKIGYNID